jgi:hypothetical protein
VCCPRTGPTTTTSKLLPSSRAIFVRYCILLVKAGKDSEDKTPIARRYTFDKP